MTVAQRHAARRNLFRATLVGSIGNVLVGNLLVLNMLSTLDVSWGKISVLVFGMPWLTGVFRFLVPPLLERIRSLRQFCVAAYVLEACCWLGMPWWVACEVFSVEVRLGMVLGCWFVATFCESAAFLALTTWQGCMFPAGTRGRFFGNLNRWRIGGELLAFLAVSIPLSLRRFYELAWTPEQAQLEHRLLIGMGVFFLLTSLLFLREVPDVSVREESKSKEPSVVGWGTWFRTFCVPLRDVRFRWLLVYGAFFSFFTQLEQSPQNQIPYRILLPGTVLWMMLGLRTLVRVGQWGWSMPCGKWMDRWGAPWVMLMAQFLTSFGPLFYLFATPERWWLLPGASICWIAYVGLNVSLPQIQLQLAGRHSAVTWLAVYGTVCGIFACGGLLIGGMLYDGYHTSPNFFSTVFLLSFVARLVSCAFLAGLLWSVRSSQK